MKTCITNTSAYKFVNLDSVDELRWALYLAFTDYNIKGTILLAEEGINLMLAGDANTIAKAKAILAAYAEFADLIYRDTYSTEIPFEKFRIKVKNEIVPMGLADVHPGKFTASKISPQQLKHWLDSKKDFILLDTRNDYEVKLGSFTQAIHYNIRNFRDFATVASRVTKREKEKPLVMFCTGGIRCEKASALLLQQGFDEVYQLQGGIINYFQQVGGAHYHGDCFVFDYRTAITPEGVETGLAQCERCQQFVTAAEQARTNYRRGDHCIHCMPSAQSSMSTERKTPWL